MLPSICKYRSKVLFKAGLGNVRPAGLMQPAKHLNVSREPISSFKSK